MLHAYLRLGRAYSFDYPRHNYNQLPSKTEVRRIAVESIRDTLNEPLDRITEALNPLLRRGRWLVTGIDLDKNAERSFYVDSMTNIQTLSDDDLQPLKGVEYVVVEQHRVAFKSQRLMEALEFRSGRRYGAVCAVLFHSPRNMRLDSA